MNLSSYSPGYYLRISSFTVSITLLLMYLINQHSQHDPPFPRQTISQVARHYPQFIIFRFITITNSIFPLFGWIVNYFHIKNICEKNDISILKWVINQITMIMGIIGSLSLMCSSAYVNTGYQDNQIHLKYAAIFFICTVTAQVINTIIYGILTFCYKSISLSYSLINIKIFQIILIFIQLFVMFNFQLFIKSVPITAHFVYGKLICTFIQWSLTYTIMTGYVLIGYDLDEVQLVYERGLLTGEEDYQALNNVEKLEWEEDF